jgi:hypothetical protein
MVHCLRCARALTPDLKGWICLEEYHLEEELLTIYDSFRFGASSAPAVKLESSLSRND